MRITKLLLVGALLAAPLVHPEVWSVPGGISATGTSQQIDFPEALGTIKVHNDDLVNSIHIRLFECGETPAAATTTNLELKPGQSMEYKHGSRTETGLGYCALTVVCEVAGPCPVRVDSPAGGPDPVVVCPCALGGDIGDWLQAECIAQPNSTGSPPRSVSPTCLPPPANPGYLLGACDPGGVYPPNNMIIAASYTTDETCDFTYASCPGTLPCTPSTDFASGVLPVTAEELAVCDALIANSGYCS